MGQYMKAHGRTENRAAKAKEYVILVVILINADMKVILKTESRMEIAQFMRKAVKNMLEFGTIVVQMHMELLIIQMEANNMLANGKKAKTWKRYILQSGWNSSV
jgi:uncharacterized membrane protein